MQADVEIYVRSIRALCPDLTDEELSQFAAKLTLLELDKKDLFIQSGKVQKALGFVTKGLIRSFFVDFNGNEINVGFYAEGDYATHYPAFITRQPSSYTIQCLEPTTFLCLTFEDLQWIYQQYPKFERYGRLVAEEILKRQQARIESFVFQTAEERYLDFAAHHAPLFNRVSLSQLSSYLGIERQTLTRIRQKLAHK